jgi:L-threonylcarbamoyladenylate synthase
MLSHYAPRKPLYLETDPTTAEMNPEKVGVLRFQTLKKGFPEENQVCLSPSGNLAEAAKNLFSALHRLDHLAVDFIVAEAFPERGLGKAINDRLFRAAAKK